MTLLSPTQAAFIRHKYQYGQYLSCIYFQYNTVLSYLHFFGLWKEPMQVQRKSANFIPKPRTTFFVVSLMVLEEKLPKRSPKLPAFVN